MRWFKPKHSLYKRIALAKLLGALFGLMAGFVFLPMYAPELYSTALAWGFLVWYVLLGAFVGVFGLVTQYPIWPSKKSTSLLGKGAWRPVIRGAWIGIWFYLVLGLFLYENLETFINNTNLFPPLGSGQILCLMMLEGAIVGAIIDSIATKLAGEGKKLL
jgi:hypothetical protein